VSEPLTGRNSSPASAPVPIRPLAALAALALFAALAAFHTWPLASAPAVLSRNDNGDTILHEWIMAWVPHQLIRHPLHLFDANIFYPDRFTLAYSDHLFLQSMLGAPLTWSGANPVLVHNLVLLAGFALTGWTTCLVLQRWTGSWLAGLTSGTLLAFNAFSLTRLPQIQDLHLEFFAPAIYALDRLLTSARVRHALQLALWFVLQSLTGTYLMVFTAIALAAAALARPGDLFGSRFRAIAPKIVLAAAIAVVALAPLLLPYYWAGQAVGLGRTLEETQRYSAEWTDYLAAPGWIYFDWWGKRFFQGDALFPGLTALTLAAVAIAASGRRDARVRMLVVIASVAFALSFGPAFPPYRWLYSVFPPLQGIRGAVRLGQIVLAAIGLLAGLGVAQLQRRLSVRSAAPVCIAALLAAHLEAWRGPIGYTEYHGIAPIYDALDQLDPNAIVVWMPFFGSAQFHLNAPFMLVSTRHFHRMLNGYSGFKPPSYYEHVQKLAGFPDETSLGLLNSLNVTAVLVDGRNMRRANLDRIDQFSELSLWKTDGNLRIYLLRHPSK
jgi:hypothetical protein